MRTVGRKNNQHGTSHKPMDCWFTLSKPDVIVKRQPWVFLSNLLYLNKWIRKRNINSESKSLPFHYVNEKESAGIWHFLSQCAVFFVSLRKHNTEGCLWHNVNTSSLIRVELLKWQKWSNFCPFSRDFYLNAQAQVYSWFDAEHVAFLQQVAIFLHWRKQDCRSGRNEQQRMCL